MTKRTSSGVKGDIGEDEVRTLMRRHGMVVNGLTESDAGWDLHAMLPALPMFDAEKRAALNSWKMAGKTCHIQVKNTEKFTLRIGTVRAWVDSNTPTFLFTKTGGEWFYASPNELSKWVAQFPTESDEANIVNRQKSRANKTVKPLDTVWYNPNWFGTIAHLWAFYPAMAKDDSLVWLTDLMITDRSTASEELKWFAVNVAYGLWFLTKPSRDEIVNFNGNQVGDLARLLAETGILETDDPCGNCDDFRFEALNLIGEMVDDLISEKHGWSEPVEPASRYTQARDHNQRLEDAIATVKSLVELLEADPAQIGLRGSTP